MHLNTKLFTTAFILFLFMSTEGFAQKNCCDSKAHTEANCDKDSAKEPTSGCTPSNCRCAKTKFGEAKAIIQLRQSLIEVKAIMEDSKNHAFSPRSYDIHGIVGTSDEESLKIIIKELKTVESELKQKLSYRADAFELPKEKAKQVQYLAKRLDLVKNKLND